MGILQFHRRRSKDQEISPELQQEYSYSLSTQQSLASVASLSIKQPSTTVNHQCITTFKAHTSSISTLTVAGKHLLSGSSDTQIRFWPRDESLPTEQNLIASDGYVYTGSADRKIKVWRKDVGEKKHKLVDTLEKHKSAVNALALSADETVLYSGACDRSIIVWEKGTAGGDERHMVVAGALRGHSMAVLCITVVGDLVVSGSADKTVRVWKKGIDGKKYSRVCVLEGHNGPVKCLAAALDGCTGSESSGTSYVVYSGSLDCDVKVWKVSVPLL
ncbi:putative [Myosin heavy-chain] kinase transcription factor WD40-like family [Helianthus annuus]|nr:putative [Myosin heavy-chain] kinase transcription factor WD40-like family [Helianthus annuus]KAJ0446955.1 putative [Myosin heavy-chain] kinase transcription factor WD40-like family [Helianthus annuus]KAJ0631856.1 putative [Myosin heavy-chain] kinase transcription factor WD40-like family [Helianthus annuus]